MNARGTPLTAADLIRNFVFQRLAAEGADTRAHLADWPFETEFWEKDVSVGRFPMQRSSLFFNQWLIARVGEEVSPRATFTRFKQYVEQVELDNGQKVADLLPLIRRQAERYEAWTVAADDGDRQLNRVELAVYRMKASDSELLKPVLIWLHEPGRGVPADVINRLASTGAWEARTALVRADGLLDIDGKAFDSPSGAGRYVKGSVTNGWRFWSLPDGRRLLDVRAIYTGEDPAKATPSFDWSALHAILEALPAGRWTTYGSLADAVGKAAQPLGSHVSTCQQCTNAHRIIKSDGAVASHFR